MVGKRLCARSCVGWWIRRSGRCTKRRRRRSPGRGLELRGGRARAGAHCENTLSNANLSDPDPAAHAKENAALCVLKTVLDKEWHKDELHNRVAVGLRNQRRTFKPCGSGSFVLRSMIHCCNRDTPTCAASPRLAGATAPPFATNAAAAPSPHNCALERHSDNHA